MYHNRRHLDDERWHSSSDLEENQYGKPDLKLSLRINRIATLLPSSSKSRKFNHDKKQFCELNRKGKPCGKMVVFFCKDLCAFVRSLDPSKGWEKQMQEDRLKLEDHLYNKWEFYGNFARVSLRFLKMEVGKALINI
jgi:hypothetical protein